MTEEIIECRFQSTQKNRRKAVRVILNKQLKESEKVFEKEELAKNTYLH